MMKLLIKCAERGLFPDFLSRFGIQQLLKKRLQKLELQDCERELDLRDRFVETMFHLPIALTPEKANEQHYEQPPEFFEQILGPHLKYSCGWWDESTRTLKSSEEKALKISCEHADLQDGQKILELGCGWGSFSLWMAEHYPNSFIIAVTNSSTQKDFIMKRIEELEMSNIEVLISDMNNFSTKECFDRVVSIEMFEHMRNWPALFKRIEKWINPNGKFFMHVFCHRQTPYLFEAVDENDWMARFFFSGGIMPCDQLPYLLDSGLLVEKHWRWDGNHYRRTALAWLEKMELSKPVLAELFLKTYGHEANLWWQRWRLFFLAVAELFGYRKGQEWWVSHYRMHCSK